MEIHLKLIRQAFSASLSMILTIAAGLGGGLLMILQALFLSGVINRVFLHNQTLPQVLPELTIIVLIILGRAITTVIGEIAASHIAIRVKTTLRKLIFQHLIKLGPAYVQGEKAGELTSVGVQGIDALDAYFSQYLPQVILAGLVPTLILVFVFPLDWVSGIILLLTAPLIPVFMVLIGRAAEALTNQQWKSLSRMSAFLLDTIQGLVALKNLGQSLTQADRIAAVSERYRIITMNVLRVTFLSAFVLELVGTISTALIAVQIGLRVLYNQMDFQQAFFILLITPEFYMPLRLLGQRFHAGMAGVSAARRIFEILCLPLPEIKEPIPSKYLSNIQRISFQNISFAYRDQPEVETLVDVSFSIHRGEVTALVGSSGSGKTTILRLLLRFLAPSSGRLMVDEQQLEAIPPDQWHQHIAWVSQNPYLFYGTLEENIRLGKPDATPAEVMQAVQHAGLTEMLDLLPDGLSTLVGEGGVGLSGGEVQRVALARAFLKNSPILILDEPGANLDPEQEARLEETIQELCRNRTVLVIAHRKATILNASQVIVLEKGRVLESGTPQSLAEHNGAFRNLFGSWGEAV